MKILLLMIAFALGWSETSEAYPLRLQTIVNKMTRNNGRNSYKVVREVTFESQDTREKVKETWLVRNGDQMKLTVESTDPNNPWSFEILYQGNKRQTLTSSGKVKTFKRSEEFFEPLYHDRSSESLMSRMINFRFIPEWAKNLPPPDYVNGKTKMKDEPFVRIVPGNGSVAYAIGSRQVASEGELATTLWVEQDSFLIRKGLLRSKSQFTSENFQTISGGLKLPRSQVVSWGNRVARVNMLTAELKPIGAKDLSFFPDKSKDIPDNQIIKEFYSRFR